MKYLVEVRLAYEVLAGTADEALMSVSASIQCRNAINVEYLVRQRPETATAVTSERDDHQGLDKPVYTVAEVASLLRSSRSSVYELVRRGVKSLRMGRRVLIPRGTVVAILNGDIQLEDRETAPSPPPPRRPAQRVRESSRAEVSQLPAVRRQRAKPEKPEPKSFVSLTEAARLLRITVPRLRELVAQRKIYYIDTYGKLRVPLQAIENFVNGLPAISLLEENIAAHKAAGPWDSEMEEIAQKLLAEWTPDD